MDRRTKRRLEEIAAMGNQLRLVEYRDAWASRRARIRPEARERDDDGRRRPRLGRAARRATR